MESTRGDPFEGIPLPSSPTDYCGAKPLSSGRTADRTNASLAALSATPFRWRDPATIPPRQWLYGRHLIRGFVSATIAPGGVGKTSLSVVDALAMATGRKLTDDIPHSFARVWLVNLEDPRDEMERRIAAAALHHGVSPEEIGDRLFLDIGRERPIVVAEGTRAGIEIARPVLDAIEAQISANHIDVLVIDPFVSSHRVSENDNMAIDAIAKEWAALAGRTGCAIDLVHHVRKLGGQEATAEDARGGSALIGAVRAVRVINSMSASEAQNFGIPEEARRAYFRVDDGKANMAPPAGARWRHLASVSLGNATPDRPDDMIGVVENWDPPDPLDGVSVEDVHRVQMAVDGQSYRENVQASDWVGYTIGRTLEIDIASDAGRSQVKRLIKLWCQGGALKVIHAPDKKGNPRPVIEVGTWVK